MHVYTCTLSHTHHHTLECMETNTDHTHTLTHRQVSVNMASADAGHGVRGSQVAWRPTYTADMFTHAHNAHTHTHTHTDTYTHAHTHKCIMEY